MDHRIALSLLMLVAVTGCMAPQVRKDQQQQRQLTPGDRSASAARRTADNRPRPKPPKRPFDADRAGTEPYRADRTAGDSQDTQQFQRFECVRLQEHYACPLLAHRWQARDIAGGIELAARVTGKRARMLRDFVRCHHRFGRRDPNDQSCLLQFRPVTVSGGVRKSNKTVFLRLVVPQQTPEQVKKLRRGVRALLEL